MQLRGVIGDIATFALAFVIMALVIGCEQAGESTGRPVAWVGDITFTDTDVEKKLEEIPDFARGRFEGDKGKLDLLNRMIEEEVLYQAALDLGLEDDELVMKQIQSTTRRILIEQYYRSEIEAKAELTPKQVEEYYNQHQDEFHTDEQAKVRHILVESEAEAKGIANRLAQGEDFEALAKEHSIDKESGERGGLIFGYVTKGKPIRTIGRVPELEKEIFSLEPGEISSVVHTAKGYHILKLEEKRAAGVEPLEDVVERIKQSQQPEVLRETMEAKLAELKERYNVRVEENALVGPDSLEGKSAEELFTMAQQATDAQERLRLYQAILDEHPDDPRTFEAQFMIGFVYSEELNDGEKAREALEAVIADYPDCDLVESAQWMLENMGQAAPEFSEEGR